MVGPRSARQHSGIVMGDLRLQVVGPRSIGISGTILGLLWVTHSVTSGRTTFHRNFKIMYFESSWVTYSVTSGRTTFHGDFKKGFEGDIITRSRTPFFRNVCVV